MNSNLEKVGEKESSKTLKKGKSDKKKYAALIMKILKRINEEMDKDTVLRNKIKKWLKITKSLQELQNDLIGKGLTHITKYNSKKNYDDFIKKLREIFLTISKKEKLKNLLPKRKDGDREKLLKNLLRWRNRISPKEKTDLSNYKGRYLKNIITKRDLEKLIRAIYKWKSNLKPKTNNASQKYGLELLNKILKKYPFNQIKRTESKKIKN